MNAVLRTIGRIESWNRRFCLGLEVAGAAGLVAVMLVTCWDVMGAKIFRSPVFGSIDMVMMIQLAAIASGISSTLIAGGHIRVIFFVGKLPRPIRNWVFPIIDVLCLLLFVLIVWRLFLYGLQLHHEGEVTPTAHIPLYPVVWGVCLAVVPVCVVFAMRFARCVIAEKPVVIGRTG